MDPNNVAPTAGAAAVPAEMRARLIPGGVIACPPGWTTLLADLDRDLAALDPEYVLLGVREKHGLLRVYLDCGAGTPPCCLRWPADEPIPETHYKSRQHRRAENAWYENRDDAILYEIVRKYTERSRGICAQCAAPVNPNAQSACGAPCQEQR